MKYGVVAWRAEKRHGSESIGISISVARLTGYVT